MSGAADIGAGTATSTIPLSRAAGNPLTLVGPYHNNPMVVNGVARVAVIASAQSGSKARTMQKVLAGKIDRCFSSGARASLPARLPDVARPLASDVRARQSRRPGHVGGAAAGQRGRGGALGTLCQSRSSATHGAKAQSGQPRRPIRSQRRRRHGHRWLPPRQRDVIEKYVLGAWKGVKFTRENPAKAAATGAALHPGAQSRRRRLGDRLHEGRVRSRASRSAPKRRSCRSSEP